MTTNSVECRPEDYDEYGQKIVPKEILEDPDRITKNFHLSELLVSQTASRRGINNTPSSTIKKNLIESTVNLWQPVRDLLGSAMIVSSGYRSPELNRAIGGSKTSAHCHGRAIDFTCPRFGNTTKIAHFLANKLSEENIPFDQIILEFPNESSTWIHLGYKSPSGVQRKQLLTAVKRGGKVVYLNGLVNPK